MDYRHEAQPRRPGRDVARRRVEPAADRVRSTWLQVGYVESARPRKGSSTMSTNHGGVCSSTPSLCEIACPAVSRSRQLRSNLAKLQRINMQVGTSNKQPSRVVRDLDVYNYGLRADDERTRRQNRYCLLLGLPCTFVVCARFVVGMARKSHSSWSWRS